MNRGWFIAAALAAPLLVACGGGSGAAPAAGPAATPIPSPPSLSVLGYALSSGVYGTPRVLGEYPLASSTPMRTFTELGGTAIRFDPSGTLWSDRIGQYDGYRADGSSAGSLNPPDQLLAFDVHGVLYAASCCGLDVFSVGSGNTTTLVRSIVMTTACSAAADGAGNIYVSTCRAGPTGPQWSPVSQYGPSANGSATPISVNNTAHGPITVDHSGNVYAPYNGSIGIWNAGTFGAGTPDRSLPIAAGNAVNDLAADRAGNVYVITRPASSNLSLPRTLLYFAAGTVTPVTLQSGDLGSVAAVP